MTPVTDQENKSAGEQAIEALLYAPVGLASLAKAVFPRLVEVGRAELTAGNLSGQFTAAKLAGKLALREARDELNRSWERQGSGQAASNNLSSTNGTGNGQGTAGAAPRTVRSTTTAGPEAELLAIPDYDSLSASQVLPRLVALNPEELEAVRSYEDGHRGRRTVLAKIAQMQSSSE